MKGLLKTISLLMAVLLTHAFAAININQVNDFGENPGNLKMFYYAPKKVSGKAPLVVLVHGCAQSAVDFDDEIGWVNLAKKNNFYLLIPQQQETNNDWRCFNWFTSEDNARGNGEAASIINMVEKMQQNFSIDDRQIFITGLSAGAAMTSAILANYPEVFNAGGIVAGIPYGCATNAINAWQCMYGMSFPVPSREERGKSIINASGNYKGKFPRVMVIHGKGDEFVNYKNADYSVDQWTYVHGIDNQEDECKISGNLTTKDYKKDNETVVKLVSIKGLRHGYPIDSKSGCGTAGKYILDEGYCAALGLSKFFGIIK